MREWWMEKIEAHKQGLALSDVKLAKRLDISPAMMGHVRAGTRDLPLQARIRLLHEMGYTLSADLLARIVPEPLRDALEAVWATPGAAKQLPSFGPGQPNQGLESPPLWT